MTTDLSTLARAGIVALAVLTGFAGGAVSAPVGPVERPLAPVAAGGGAMQDGRLWQINDHWGGNRKWRGNRYWRGNGNWHNGGNWRNNGNWRRGGYWRGRPYGNNWRYRNYNNSGVGIALGLGVPLFGGYYANPGYYPGPGYYAPPRRYYRAPVAGNAHVRWCYERYRSYRAWDNSFQPYNGPRSQCYSPYD